jgi:hypothetical protein
MNRRKINRISAVIPIFMSLAALLIVLIAVATGWERNLKDEGIAAHIFQLLVVAQAPIILLFLLTADWKRLVRVARPLAFQILGLGIAFGSVAFFKL